MLQATVLEDADDVIALAVLERPVRWLAVRLERAAARWSAATLRADPRRTFPAGTAAGLEHCGTPIELRRIAGGFRLDTHVNPSAACAAFLGPGLEVRALLWGWPVVELPDTRYVYQRSQVHFTASHPLELRLFDAARLADTAFHPVKPWGAIRAGFVARLRWTFTPEWCRPRNHPCDPERPNETIVGDIAVSPARDAIAFLTTLEEDAISPIQAVYVYRGLGPGQRPEFREIGVGDFRARFGTVAPARALEPETQAQIFGR